jgi:hypothetical protein
MVAALYFCCMMACVFEENTKVSIDGNNPPKFKLDGSGHQMFFLVSEIPPENLVPSARQNPDKNIELWEIQPDVGTMDIASSWPQITYGKVPPGFRQKTPSQGEAPKLVEGKVYGAGGLAYGANGGGIWFSIRDGKSVLVQEPGAR